MTEIEGNAAGKMRRRASHWRVGLAIAALAGTGAAAEDTGGTESDADAALAPVIVTATREQTSVWDVPYAVDVLDREDLFYRRQVRTLPEALMELPGIMVQKTAHGQGSPYIRGFTGFRTLLMIDGIRLNNSVFRDGPNQYWATVDVHSLSRLEVVRGPASVLYGSDAIGGTVNAITPLPGEPGADELVATRYRYASAEDSHVGRFGTSYGSGPWAMTLGATWKDFDDLEGGDRRGTQKQTGYDEWGADAKFAWNFNDDTQLVLAHQRVDIDDAWRSHRTIFSESWHGTTLGNEQQRILDQNRNLTYAQFRAKPGGWWADSMLASLSYHRQQEDRDRIRSNGRRDLQGFDVDTTGAWVQLGKQVGNASLVYGVEAYLDDVDSYRTDFNADGSLRAIRIQGPVADDADYDTYAAYVQDTHAFGAEWTLTAGARYTYIDTHADKVQDPVTGDPTSVSDHWDDVSASARLSYSPTTVPALTVYAGASQGFRAPNLSDLTRLDSARSNEIETPVAGLDPEDFLTGEIGLRWVGGPVTATVDLYYTDVDDAIVRTPTGRVIEGDNEVTKRNAGDGWVKGAEFAGTWAFADRWTLLGNLTLMDGELDTYPTSDPVVERETIDRLMPATVNLGVRWGEVGDPLWAEAFFTAAENQDDLSTRDQGDTQRIPPSGTPGYGVLDLRGGWQVNRALSLSLAVENLFDNDYRVHGSGLNGPGRNFVLGFAWQPAGSYRR